MGRRALVAIAIAAQAILFATTGARAATDLRMLLADPPPGTWVAIDSSPTDLVGDFSAHSYAAFLQAARASPGRVEMDLNLEGFTRGYGLEWEEGGSADVLVKRVFEFRDSGGAGYWFSALKNGARLAPQYTRDISMPSSIPNSFGAVLHAPGSAYQYRAEFTKGNLVFVVHMDSSATDLTSAAVAQAAAEYAGAPSQTQVPPGTGLAAENLIRNVEIAAGVLVVVLALIAAFALVMTRRSARAVASSTFGPTMSPDGAYWWDGALWRDAAVQAPPTAPRSPDGAFWWDGRTWRPPPVLKPGG